MMVFTMKISSVHPDLRAIVHFMAITGCFGEKAKCTTPLLILMQKHDHPFTKLAYVINWSLQLFMQHL